MTQNTELTIITASGVSLPVTAQSLFIDGKLDEILERIKEDALNILTDPTTEKGRKEIKSIAYKVAQSKTFIDDTGKTLTEQWRAQTNKVNADRKKAETFLVNLQEQIRRPVTEHENREKARVKEREDAIEEIRSLAQLSGPMEPAEYQARIDRIEVISWRYDFMEFTTKMQTMKDGAIALLTAQKADREQAIADKARLDELERINAARIQAEREAKIAEDAARAATEAAERAAQKAKEEADALAKAELDRVEREAAAAKQKAEEAALKAQADKEAAEVAARAEQERIAREAQAAIDKAHADAQAAIEAERKRVEAERIAAEKKAADEAAAEALRQADEAHRAKVLGEVMVDINKELIEHTDFGGGVDYEGFIQAILDGKIRHVTINF
jgi:colicin import membrane protein